MKVMSLLLLVFTILIISTTASGQGGYKQFKWGESIKSVKSKDALVDKIRHIDKEDLWGIDYAYYYETDFDGIITGRYEYYTKDYHSTNIKRIIEKKVGNIKGFRNKDKDTFLFADNKLFAITIYVVDLGYQKCKVVLDRKYNGVDKWKIYSSPDDLLYNIKTWFDTSNLFVVLRGLALNKDFKVVNSCELFYGDKYIYDLVSTEFNRVRSNATEKSRKKTQKSLEKIEP